ncbi:MAG: hypothetical protein IJV72_00875 [Clostridia bacterium]|nr:hypothetical protein [Clostridia bacterium]
MTTTDIVFLLTIRARMQLILHQRIATIIGTNHGKKQFKARIINMKEENKLSRFIMNMRLFKGKKENLGKDGTTLFNEFKVFEEVNQKFDYYERAEAVRKAILEFSPHFDSVHLEGELKGLNISENQWKSILEALEQSKSHLVITNDTAHAEDENDGDDTPSTAPCPYLFLKTFKNKQHNHIL